MDPIYANATTYYTKRQDYLEVRFKADNGAWVPVDAFTGDGLEDMGIESVNYFKAEFGNQPWLAYSADRKTMFLKVSRGEHGELISEPAIIGQAFFNNIIRALQFSLDMARRLAATRVRNY